MDVLSLILIYMIGIIGFLISNILLIQGFLKLEKKFDI